MKRITARLKCTSVAEAGGAKQVTLEAVPSVKPEDPNYSWSQMANPQAKVELTVSNPSAHNVFVQGEEVDVEFKKVK